MRGRCAQVVPKSERINVCVRKRPLNRREAARKENDICTVNPHT
jgi:hypothetical protein